MMGEGRAGPSDFLGGSEILAKSDIFGFMKDVGIFFGREKSRGIFWGCEERTNV